MNDLAKYLSSNGLTQKQFAGEVGVDQATISKLCRAKCLPSLELAVCIEQKTAGAVAASSWLREGGA